MFLSVEEMDEKANPTGTEKEQAEDNLQNEVLL